MTNDQIRRSLVYHLTSSWGTCTLIARPNRTFEPPSADLIDTNYKQPNCFIQYFIRMTPTVAKEIKGVALRYGVLMIEINQPLETATNIGNQLADRMEAAFRQDDLGGVQIGEPYSIELGELQDGSFYRFMVNIPFSCWVGE